MAYALEVTDFSRHVRGAADHFKFRVSEHSLACGQVRGNSLVVTYGKLGAAAHPRDRAEVEAVLERLYGTVVVVEGEQPAPVEPA